MDGNHTTAPTSTGGRRAERKRDARTDGGYILVTLGLMIIPLMAFAALAVDVGSWYARTTELQKAADSAALAGVIWAPDYARARTVAAKTRSPTTASPPRRPPARPTATSPSP